MTIYVIGDLQGCHDSCRALLDLIHDQPHPPGIRPELWFAGDLINRGPKSLASLRLVRELHAKGLARCVLGNHDLHLLAVAHGIRKLHRADTLAEILAAPDAEELLNWLRQQPLAIYENNHLLVHAGVLPQWDVAQTLQLAGEVEQQLRGPNWVEFLRHMYGNQPNQWQDGLQGAERARVIINGLTRLRFCNRTGVMDFDTKEGAGSAPQGFMPWFDVPGRNTADVSVICGHWSTLGLVMRENLIALDTGCVWGGKLTAVRLVDRAVLQVDCPQYCAPG